MSKEEDNKAIVGRWFTDFWGKTCKLDIVDELAAPDILLQYSLHDPRRGRDDIKAFMTDFRQAFPDLNFWGTAELIAEGDHVVGRWEGGGTHTGPAFDDFLAGSLPAATGRKMHFTGTTVLRLKDGRIVEEKGHDDGVSVRRLCRVSGIGTYWRACRLYHRPVPPKRPGCPSPVGISPDPTVLPGLTYQRTSTCSCMIPEKPPPAWSRYGSNAR